MNEQPRNSPSKQPHLSLVGKTQRRLEPAEVAAALGAEPVSGSIQGNPGPLTLYALRAELLRRRQSTGGRPGIAGTSQRVKIPLSEADWHKLEDIAAALTTSGFSPSPAQVASVLLSVAIQSVQGSPGGETKENALVEVIAQRLTMSGGVPPHSPTG